MKNFTFAMITYNQQDYVLEHLESIKFQVMNYGNGYEINFLLSDDASTDNTVNVVKEWLSINKHFFKNIKILVSEINIGIVGNMIRTLKNIETNEYKILAGDDLYFKNSIFDINIDSEFILTPILMFKNKDRKVLKRNKKDIIKYKRYILKDRKNKLFKLIKENQKYENNIEAPTVFMKHSIIDLGLYDLLKEYSWIDDVPTWYYFFYKKNKKFKVSFDKIPKILYRCDVGISSNINHSKRNVFNEDLIKIENDIYINNFIGYHLWKLRESLSKMLIKYYFNVVDEELKEFENNYHKAENEVEEYLMMIKKNVHRYQSVYAPHIIYREE